MKKYITCFIASMAGGGAEHQMAFLTEMLAEKGYDVTLVTYNGVPDFYNVDSRVKRVELNVKGNKLKKWYSIYKFFKRHKTDCIISFREQMNFILLLAVLFKKVKVIVGERNTTIGSPTKYGWINIHCLYNRAAYIVPNSYTQKKYIDGHNKRLAEKTITIINYTDLDVFKQTELPEIKDTIKIGIFARFYAQKNYERFAYMLAELKKERRMGFHITWYGNQYNKEKELSEGYLRFMTLIKSLEIDDVIRLSPSIKDVPHEIEKYHAICLPSLYEGFSNSVSEGICSGRPMLVSDVSDNSLMVHEGENGFLFNPLDIEDMKRAFLGFLSLDYSMMVLMGNRSREIAEKLFNKENFVSSYVNLIEN